MSNFASDVQHAFVDGGPRAQDRAARRLIRRRRRAVGRWQHRQHLGEYAVAIEEVMLQRRHHVQHEQADQRPGQVVVRRGVAP